MQYEQPVLAIRVADNWYRLRVRCARYTVQGRLRYQWITGKDG